MKHCDPHFSIALCQSQIKSNSTLLYNMFEIKCPHLKGKLTPKAWFGCHFYIDGPRAFVSFLGIKTL